MKTKKKLDRLLVKISEAETTYHLAVQENLLEIGHPVSVYDEMTDEVGIRVNVMLYNGIVEYTIDQIKCEEGHSPKVHVTNCDGKKEDYWMDISDLEDTTNYVLEAIQWIDHNKLQIIDGDIFEGTAHDVYSLCPPEILLYFVHHNGRIENVRWHQSIDDFRNCIGAFAVEKSMYDTALRQIRKHKAKVR